ncbi:rhomboid domain-containing protein 2 [Aplochiton taeniatus]
MISVTTMHTRMAKAYLLGVNVPTVALPWMFLLMVTILIPHTVFIGNVIAILTGWIYGKGWFSLIDMSEARACVLDKWRLFRLLKNINGLLYIPASVEKRRKTLYPRINPTPGSYPTQAYAPVSSPSNAQASWASSKTYEGWPHPTYTQSGPIPPTALHGHSDGREQSFGQSHGHSHEQHLSDHNHGHSHVQGQYGHSHEHNFGHGHSFEPQWASTAPYSQHSHQSPTAIFPGQSGSDSVKLSDAQGFSTNMVGSELSSVIHIGPHNNASLS